MGMQRKMYFTETIRALNRTTYEITINSFGLVGVTCSPRLLLTRDCFLLTYIVELELSKQYFF